MGLKYSSLLFVSLFVMACAQGNCRHKAEMPAYPNAGGVPTDTNGSAKSNEPAKIYVFKYDGSLQCGEAKGQSLKEMQKELGDINVFSSEKKPDGLMHIQVCGSATGMANVYEILEGDFAKAQAKGFRKWGFQ